MPGKRDPPENTVIIEGLRSYVTGEYIADHLEDIDCNRPDYRGHTGPHIRSGKAYLNFATPDLAKKALRIIKAANDKKLASIFITGSQFYLKSEGPGWKPLSSEPESDSEEEEPTEPFLNKILSTLSSKPELTSEEAETIVQTRRSWKREIQSAGGLVKFVEEHKSE